MQTVKLGSSSLVSSRLAYGCWRSAGTWNPSEVAAEGEAAGVRGIIAAYEAGYTLFDNADIYCRGVCEQILGRALREVAGMRERVLVATKCGIRLAGEPQPEAPKRYDFSGQYIVRACEGSLRRLGIETIDLYMLHRPDYLADPHEIAGAFVQLYDAGKVRCFGVSNFRPSLVSALQAACPLPLVVNQVEISLARLNCFTDGTLDQCLEKGITPQAWSPLGGGLLADGTNQRSLTPVPPHAEGLVAALDSVAGKYGVSRSVIALAWLLKHPSRIMPIIGSTNPQRIQEVVAADRLELSREEWYQLLIAARGTELP
ncbi:MAG: aldo/keto reductase [Verrucomicrobiae bacterium]|nr:aldo/keto reductase [Verrucomicrobiae bacterium]